MPSPSSTTQVRQRAEEFWREADFPETLDASFTEYGVIQAHLEREYEQIPEKERIGKGRAFVGRCVAEGIFRAILAKGFPRKSPRSMVKPLVEPPENPNVSQFIEWTDTAFDEAEANDYLFLQYFCTYLLAELVRAVPDTFQQAAPVVKKWAQHENWEIRENAAHPIRAMLKYRVRSIFEFLTRLTEDPDANLRRLVAESTRPMSDIKWLRDPAENDPILELLSKMRADTSEYVRKSVGNNLKDLSKYMPTKILALAGRWITEAQIGVSPDLASKTKNELGSGAYYLIWTLKHALRWVQARNPEYHKDLEQILGQNYVLYFNEKKNRLARPE